MCEWGKEELVDVTIPADLSHTGEERSATVGIDACIASIVRALNQGGVKTRSSCCGHGTEPGQILLADGRVLLVCTDKLTARCVQNDMAEEDRSRRELVAIDAARGVRPAAPEVDRDA